MFEEFIELIETVKEVKENKEKDILIIEKLNQMEKRLSA